MYAVNRAEVQPSSLQESLIGLIRAFGLHQPDRTPCGQPVPVSEAHALAELARTEPLGQMELARRLSLERSTVSRIVAQLQARDWVAREADPIDGRVSLIRLTVAGRRAAEQLAQARTVKFAALLDAIPEHERSAVVRALDIMTEALHEH
jgi:DNA-binding MarR family transcriptional regulator